MYFPAWILRDERMIEVLQKCNKTCERTLLDKMDMNTIFDIYFTITIVHCFSHHKNKKQNVNGMSEISVDAYIYIVCFPVLVIIRVVSRLQAITAMIMRN